LNGAYIAERENRTSIKTVRQLKVQKNIEIKTLFNKAYNGYKNRWTIERTMNEGKQLYGIK
jgi:hypothetical protein